MYLMLLSVLFTSVCLVSPCPGGCECSVSSQVSCISPGILLTRIPELPADTLRLTVNNQNIERIYKDDFTGENVSGLEFVDLARNNIRMVDGGAFEELGDLTILYLNDNLISAINESTFSNLRKLQELILYRNNIGVIADGAFEGLKTLITLDLLGNSISVVNEFTFCGLQHMEFLYLTANNIESIDAASLSEQRNLKRLHLAINPLLCGCGMQWLVDFIADKGVVGIGTCHSPDMMKGTSLGDLSDEDFTSCQFTTADIPSIRSTTTGGGRSTSPDPPSPVFSMKPSPSVPLKQSSLPAVTVDTSWGDSSHRGGYHVVLITSFLSGGALIVILVVFCLFLKGIRGRLRQRDNGSSTRGGRVQMSDYLNHASGTDN